MKTCTRFFIFLLLALGLRPAQAQGPDSLRTALDRLFAPLDKAQVPVPYLYEYGNRFVSALPHNGTLTDSSVATLLAWPLLYASVISGNVGRPSPLPAPATINAALAAQVAATPEAIPVVLQCLPYATLRPDARPAGLLTAANGQLFDVPGRLASPYVRRTLFAAAPARFQAPTGTVAFVFAPALHVSAGGTGAGSLSALALDFGDGRGYLPVAWNVPLAARYCTPGRKRVRVRATYGSGGSAPVPLGGRVQAAAAAQPQAISYESWFDLYVQTADCAVARYNQSDVAGLVRPFPAVPGLHSGGTAYVRFGGGRTPGDQTIRRPLIVAEGYDGFSVAPAVYKRNYGIQDFLDDLRKIDSNFSSLYSKLENAVDASGSMSGYDIIFLDYANGTDDIRRNAALFEDVVRWVNATKQPVNGVRQQNVVLGVSMGGLVARYGLAELVKTPNVVNGVNRNDPDTRLLVTHDSPHRGANTPLGIQMLTRQAASTLAAQTIRVYNYVVTNNPIPLYLPALTIFPELEQAENLLDAPATQQLLVVRGTRSGAGPLAQFGAQYNTFLDTDYRAMITPAAGQALPYRFVATSLGSECGQAVLNPYAELVRVVRSGYFGLVGFTGGYKTEIVVNALPVAGRVERLSSLRVWTEARVLGISLGRVYLTNYVYHSPASNPVAWDGLPGGTQPVRASFDLAQGSSYFDRIELVFAWGNASDTYLADNFCFVPRASALDVLTLDAPSLTGIYANGATNGSASRAAAVVGQVFQGDNKYNQAHPFFASRQAQWLFNEMQRPFNGNANALACNSNPECNPFAGLAISGPGTLCGPGTYSSPAQGSNYTYTWTASPAANFTVGSGTGPTFTTANVGNGTGTVTLTLSSGCPYTFTKAVKTGKPAPPAVEFVQAHCWNNVFHINNYDATIAYRVAGACVNSSVSVTQISPSVGSFILGGQVGGNCDFSVTARNNCGSDVDGLGLQVTYEACRGTAPAPPVVTLFPNPANEAVDVQVANADPSQALTVRLYDAQGQPRRQATDPAGDDTLHLDTSTLPNGLYYLQVVQDAVVIDRQALVIE